MSTFVSHHTLTEQAIFYAEQRKPFAPENGTPLRFAPGDMVIVTNDEGGEFMRRVTGYYKPEKPCALYARGYRYYLNWDCHWMPVTEASLRPANQ